MIDSVDSVYRPVFSVKFIHAAYSTPNENFFSRAVKIITDKATGKLFRHYRMDFRFFADTLICLMQCKHFSPPAAEPKTQALEIKGEIKIRFLMLAANDFYSNTYVPAGGNQHTLAFSNRVNNMNGSEIFLSSPIPVYDSGNDYTSGAVVEAGGSIYGAKKPVPASGGIALGDTGYWSTPVPAHAVVSGADLQAATVVDADEPCFAVIDLFNDGTGTSYRLFDTGGKLFNPAPQFRIEFFSRT